jgi:hypothetical protein
MTYLCKKRYTMKKILFSATLSFCALMMSANVGVLVVEGKYQQKNLFIQNGFSSSGVGFCAFQVKVNGQITTDEVNSSAFEIDFSPYKFKAGDKITVEIEHKDGCIPKVLNPEALKPKPTFDVVSISINNDAMLSWTSKNEVGSLPFVIEQFKWNKWVYVGEINGEGTPTAHDYKFKVIPHSGENKFRVKQVGFSVAPRYSDAVIYNSLMERPSYQVDKNMINFNNETSYEVYDYYGNVVKKGFGPSCDISTIKRGKYYLCYDNAVTEIEKKK